LGVVPGLSKVDPSKDSSRSRRGGTGTSSSAAVNGHMVAAAAAKPIRYCMMLDMNYRIFAVVRENAYYLLPFFVIINNLKLQTDVTS